MRKQLAAVGLTAGLAVGAVAGFTLTSGSAPVGAQGGTTTSVGSPDEGRPDPSAHIAEVLKPLVDDGTITKAQADKVAAALLAAGHGERGEHRGGHRGEHRGEHPGEHRGGQRGGPDGPAMRGGAGLDAAAATLGMTTDELVAELRKGSSVADVAKAKGVDLEKVTDALVAEATERITAKVTAGKITQEQADRRIADLVDRITRMVNGQRPDATSPPTTEG